MAALAIDMDALQEPTAEDIGAARTAARQLSSLNKGNKAVRISVTPSEGDEAPEPISLPSNVFRTLVKLLVEIGNGNAVQVVPVKAELTTQQAADYLNVSRPYLIKLLENGTLGYRMVGTHRKVEARAVMTYRDKMACDRNKALSRMVELDEELGLYDDEPISTKES
jgi:excisionase family DNA binding protein